MVQFETLPQEKQDAVLNAAFCCFGKNGYKKASVADIASSAGIAKASIFQYFGSKKALYTYLFEYACDKIISEAPAGTDDFFESLQMGAEAKMYVMARHPGMYDFLSSTVTETDEEILAEIKTHTNVKINFAVNGLLGGVNWNKLRPGISREMLLNTVRWINDGYIHSAAGKKDAETMRRELFGYLTLIKTAYYREEYLE